MGHYILLARKANELFGNQVLMRRCAGLSVSISLAIKKLGFLMTSSYVMFCLMLYIPLRFFLLPL